MTSLRQPIASVAILVAALVAAVCSIVTVPAVRAQSPPPGADHRDEGNGVALTLISQSMWTDPDGEIVIDFTVEGADPDDVVTVTVHEQLRSESSQNDLDRSITGERLGGRLTVIRLGTLAELDPDRRGGPITARIPLSSGASEGLRILRVPGVHPVTVVVDEPGGTTRAGLVTHITRIPLDDDERELVPLGVVLVAPLQAPPSLQPDGSTEIGPDVRSRFRVAATTLLDHPDQPFTLVMTPETIVALRQNNQTLDQMLVEELAQIASRGSLVSAGFVTVDIGAMARAGLSDELAGQIERGHEALQEHLGVAPVADLWFEPGELTQAALDELTSLGIRRLIVEEAGLEPLDDDRFRHRLAHLFHLSSSDGGTITALGTDPDLMAHQGASGNPVLDAQRVLANLAVRYFEDPDRARAVVIVLDADPDHNEYLGALLAGLASSPIAVVRTPADAMDQASYATAEGTDAGTTNPSDRLFRTPVVNLPQRDLSQHGRDLSLVRFSMGSFVSVFRESTDLVDRLDTRLAVTSSVALDQWQRSLYYGAVTNEIDTMLSGLDLPARRAITLPARDGNIPLSLTNNTGASATVSILLESEKLDFADGPRVVVELAEGINPIDIDVRVRSSGAFPLSVTVESPDGRLTLAQARYTVRSTAVSGLGLGISLMALAMLIVWWVRTARRARAHRLTDT